MHNRPNKCNRLNRMQYIAIIYGAIVMGGTAITRVHPVHLTNVIGQNLQESRAVARKPRDATTVLFGLKFADNIHYNFSQASKAMLQTSKHTVAKRI